MTLGKKIKKYRKRANLSQFKLELRLGMSNGHLSKIENNKTNPTKEIIVDIAKALKLDTPEIASLFGIEILDVSLLLKETTRILSSQNLLEVLDRTTNDLIFKLGYIASTILLIDKDQDKINFAGLTNSNISKKTLDCLDRQLESLSLSLSRDIENLSVKAIKENKVYLTHNTYEYTVPAVSKETADKIQEVTGDKSNIIYPLSVNGQQPFGVIVYVKKIISDFESERETLKIISNQIAVAISNAIKFNSLIIENTRMSDSINRAG